MYEKFYPDYSQSAPKQAAVPLMTWLIALSTVAVFLGQLYDLNGSGRDVIGDEFAFSPQRWNGTSPWTVLTCAWVHLVAVPDNPNLYWVHITGNMIPLICFAPALEKELGHLSFLILYLGGAVASALTWVYLSADVAIDQHLLGASGAVSAVMAGLATAAPRMRVVVTFLPFFTGMMGAGAAVLAFCVIQVILLPFQTGVAHSAHLGGAIFGFLYVLIFHHLLGRPYLSD